MFPLLGNGAPDDPDALASRLEKRYAGVRDLRAEFVQVASIASLGREEVSSGWVAVKRPGKMRWEYREPAATVMVVDEKTLRIFNPAERQLQVAPLGAGTFSPTAIGFLLGSLELKRVFVATLPAEGRADRRGLVLRPREPASFESLELWLDPETLQLRESVVHDLFGNRTELRLSDVQENIGVREAVFTLEVPDDIDVIDLRP